MPHICVASPCTPGIRIAQPLPTTPLVWARLAYNKVLRSNKRERQRVQESEGMRREDRVGDRRVGSGEKGCVFQEETSYQGH